MNYNNYEDYMRSVLGYQNGNIYANPYGMENDFYYNPMSNMENEFKTVDTEKLNSFYPEIYKMVYPMVCKVCNQNSNREITKDLIDSMTEEIFMNFESEESQNVTNMRNLPPLKNGDVRNPNAKEPELRSETRQGNYLLRDLIRILILREFGRPNRPGFPGGGRPPIAPPMPPRPPRPPMGPRWTRVMETILICITNSSINYNLLNY